jgi:membrane-bound inhibitor of C-type lysozyme
MLHMRDKKTIILLCLYFQTPLQTNEKKNNSSQCNYLKASLTLIAFILMKNKAEEKNHSYRCRKMPVFVKVASVKQKKLTDFVANGNFRQSKNLRSLEKSGKVVYL